MTSKVLVVGSPQGNLAALFAKLAPLHAKQSFALCIILGDLFPASTPEDDPTLLSLLSGSITIPLPTYFTLGSCALPAAVAEKLTQNDNELCDNLFFLGKRGVLTTSEGIRIVALGGRHDPNLVGSSTSTVETSFLPFYSGSDAAGLRGANHCDLMVTYDWPEGVESGSGVALPDAVKDRPQCTQIAELAKALRPRYHFVAGGDGFWEREPYRNEVRGKEGAEERRITRFLSIADFGNAVKAKALYAFTVNPKDPQITPPSATASPFANLGSKKRSNPSGDDAASSGGNSFFWGDHTSSQRGHPRKRHQHQKRPPPGPDQCFFCLSNPNLEKHLIVSIGSESYLTTAKGPLTSASTNPSELSFSSHILIIPLAHTPTLQQMDAGDRETTVAEMRRYRDAIIKMLDERGAGAVTFEIRKNDGVHAHWQVIPVKKEKLSIVDDAFAKSRPGWIGEDELDDTDDAFTYWRSDATGGAGRSIRIPPNEYFDLQFGRRVLATIIDAPAEATNWRDCVLSPDDEARDADAFKKAFSKFDFTLEE